MPYPLLATTSVEVAGVVVLLELFVVVPGTNVEPTKIHLHNYNLLKHFKILR